MDIKYDENGLIPAVVQDTSTGQVLMVAWMNSEALRLTKETREAHFWSRSRRQLWRKGETSGNVMLVQEIRIDCDEDTLLLLVAPLGPACHTGEVSCFYRIYGTWSNEEDAEKKRGSRKAGKQEKKFWIGTRALNCNARARINPRKNHIRGEEYASAG